MNRDSNAMCSSLGAETASSRTGQKADGNTTSWDSAPATPTKPMKLPVFSSPAVLSLVWLALCAILVTRQNELLAIFYSFAGSFAMSALLPYLRNSRAKNLCCDYLTREGRIADSTTKNLVGLLACFCSLLNLCSIAGVLNWDSSLFLNSPTPHGDLFASLSVLTGYLLFDLWYSAFCHPPFSGRILSVIEDAVTLAVFLVFLAREGGGEGANFGEGGLAKYRREIILWVGYKVVRLVLNLSWGTGAAKSELTALAALELGGDEGTYVVSSGNIWTVHGRQYDLRDFVDRHPGGRESIELGKGRDCTALFESYHPFTEQHRITLSKFRVMEGNKHGREGAGSASTKPDLFYGTLKERAKEALREHGVDPHLDRCATPGRAVYYVLVFVCLLISALQHVQSKIFGSFCFAVFGWLIGALGHDGGHFAVSRIPAINDAAVWGISFLCNPVMWQHQHTYAHHSHTNDFDHDPDLHHFDALLRIHRRLKHESVHSLQRNPLYVFFAYAFVVFGTCIKIPIGMIFTGSLYGIVEWTDRKRPLRALAMITHYLLYIGLVFVAPFFSGKSWYIAILAGITHIATAGILFAVFSQVNHLNEHSIEVEGTGCDLLKSSWAAKQVVTSNNFATEKGLYSFLWHFLSNGLNMQIEHHLFPGLNHTHLHIIGPSVRKTCEEFGVPYKTYETWSDLFKATLQWLDALSTNERAR